MMMTEDGIFFPQNSEYTNTTEMVKIIGKVNGKKIIIVKGFTWFLNILSHFTAMVNKAFGNLSYDMRISEYKQDYRKFTFEDSIRLTEE